MAAGDLVPIGLRRAHDTAPALTMALLLSLNVHGKGGHAAAERLQCSRLWEFIQSGQPRTNARPTEAACDPLIVIAKCPSCANFILVRSGTCLKCDTCGSTTGCS